MKMSRGSYQIGTRVQDKNGGVKVKIVGEDGKPTWEAEARRVWELYHGPLSDGDRVFLIAGVGSKIEISNLTIVHFRTEKWKVLDHSRVLPGLFNPTSYVIDKKTRKILIRS